METGKDRVDEPNRAGKKKTMFLYWVDKLSNKLKDAHKQFCMEDSVQLSAKCHAKIWFSALDQF